MHVCNCECVTVHVCVFVHVCMWACLVCMCVTVYVSLKLEGDFHLLGLTSHAFLCVLE